MKKKVLFDTNVLTYYRDETSRFHEKVVSYFADETISPVLAAQNVTEYASVLCNLDIVKKQRGSDSLSKQIELLLNSKVFKFIYPDRYTSIRFKELLAKYPVKNSRHVFDVYLVATMLSNDISVILTANTKDFQHIKEISVITL